MDDFILQLYGDTLLDLGKHRHNYGFLSGATHTAEGLNPLCGDKVIVYLILDEEDCIQELRFEGNGCAISQASASIMTDLAIGRSRVEFQDLMQSFVHLVKGEVNEVKLSDEDKELVAPFSTVWKQPMRVKCATLAWHTMKSALEGGQPARSE